MANSINATSTDLGGIVTSGDDSGILQLQTNETTAVTIDASQDVTVANDLFVTGNVGIGTSSPVSKLTIESGDASIRTGYKLYLWNAANNNAPYLKHVNGGIGFFNTSDVQAMQTDSSGNLLVGTTNSDLPSFSTTNVDGVGLSANKYIVGSGSGRSCAALKRYTSTGQVVEFWYGTSQVGNISVTGSATSYVTSSDYRLKENIAPMTGALSVVQQLNPVTYNWKVDGSDGQGFIAHELQAVVPDAVVGAKDAVDADGNPVYQGIDTSFLVATLTAAIQEQQALITTLTERITALEGATQ